MVFIYAIFGWLVGILINYLADYLPARRRAAVGAGFMPTFTAVWEWSAVIACLNGRARRAPRAIVVELFAPALFAFLWLRYNGSALLFWYTIYSAILLLVTVIDLERRLILNVVIYPAIVIALIGAFFTPGLSWRGALIGGAVGLGILFLIFGGGALFVKMVRRLRGHEIKEVPFGMGDIKLGLFIGLITGFPYLFFALLIGILAGGLGAGLYLFIKTVVLKRYSAYTAIPYGPFLILGGIVALFWGTEILHWYK